MPRKGYAGLEEAGPQVLNFKSMELGRYFDRGSKTDPEGDKPEEIVIDRATYKQVDGFESGTFIHVTDMGSIDTTASGLTAIFGTGTEKNRLTDVRIDIEGSIATSGEEGIALRAANTTPVYSGNYEVNIAASGSIVSSGNTDAISLRGGNSTIVNHGSVASPDSGGAAIRVVGEDSRIENYGTLENNAFGVATIVSDNAADGDTGSHDPMEIYNAGLINNLSGNFQAPSMLLMHGDHHVNNDVSGVINGHIEIADIDGSKPQDMIVIIQNAGVLNGNVQQFQDDDVAYKLAFTNTGTINGDITAYDGSDFITNVGGGEINGDIDLGAGEDFIFVSGVMNGAITGGADTDTFIFVNTGPGSDITITDFERGTEQLNISSYNLDVMKLAAVRSRIEKASSLDGEGDLVLDLAVLSGGSADGTLTLEGVDKLTLDDFIL